MIQNTNTPRRKRPRPKPDPAATVWRLPAVSIYAGRSRSSILRDVPAGRFPAPIKLGENSVGWLRVEVEKWLADRIAERDKAVA